VPGAEGESALAQPFLLANAVLNDVEQLGGRPHRRVFRRGLQAGDGDLFDFKGDHVAARARSAAARSSFPPAFEARVDDEARGAGGIGIHDVDAIAERARRHGDHAAELPAAENADGRAGKNRCGHSGRP